MFLCHTDSTDDTDIFSNTNLTNDTNEGAQTWLFHTDSADFTDIFCEHESHEKGSQPRLFRNYKFSKQIFERF